MADNSGETMKKREVPDSLAGMERGRLARFAERYPRLNRTCDRLLDLFLDLWDWMVRYAWVTIALVWCVWMTVLVLSQGASGSCG